MRVVVGDGPHCMVGQGIDEEGDESLLNQLYQGDF